MTIIKDGFKKLYQKPNMWNTLTNNGSSIPPYWTQNGINSDNFISAVNNLDSALYDFINVSN